MKLIKSPQGKILVNGCSQTKRQVFTSQLFVAFRAETQTRSRSTYLLAKASPPVICVLCVFSSHSWWTSSSLEVPAGVTHEEGHTGFFIHLLSAVRALILLARRIQPFLSLVDREVEFCVLTI